MVNEEVEACGVAGSFGPFSEWTESDATCGGNQWRWQIHSCDIDTATGRPKVRLSDLIFVTDQLFCIMKYKLFTS